MPQLPASACDGSPDAAGFARQPDQLIGVGFLATDEGFLHQLTLQADRCRLPHQTALKLTQRTADLTLVGTDQIAETTRTATPGINVRRKQTRAIGNLLLPFIRDVLTRALALLMARCWHAGNI